METGEAPRKNQLCDGFLSSQLLDSAEGRGKEGGGMDRGEGPPLMGKD